MGMSWGGHKVAQHKSHDPGEQQRTPFFACCLKAGKRYFDTFSGFFVIYSAKHFSKKM
jgi:hypothetical protein